MIAEEDGRTLNRKSSLQQTAARPAPASAATPEAARLYALLMQAPTIIWTLAGPDHTFDLVNLRSIEFLGYDPTGMPARAVFPELESRGLLRLLDQVYATGEPLSVPELPVSRGAKNGVPVFFNLVVEPVRDASGSVERLLVHAVDITAHVRGRREMERMAQASSQRSAELATLIEYIPAGVAVFDLDGNVVLLNEAARSYALPSELLNDFAAHTASLDLRDAATRKPLRQQDLALTRALAGESVGPHEVMLRLPHSAADVWLLTSTVPLRDEQSEISSAVSVFSDITNQQQLLREVSTSEERLRLMQDAMACGVTIRDGSGKMIYANTAAQAIFGRTLAEMRDDPGLTYHDSFAEDGTAMHKEDGPPMAALRTGRPVHNVTVSIARPSGDGRWIQVDAVPMLDEDGRVAQVVSSVIDVTERKQAEASLRRQNELLAALHDTSLALMDRLDVNDLLKAIVSRAAALAGVEHGYIYLTEPGTDEMVSTAGAGIFSARRGTRIGRGQGVGGKVWETGQPICVDDYKNWSGRVAGPARDMLRAVIGVPLKSGAEVVGVLGLAHLEPGPTFGDAEMVLLQQFAQLASIALDNARLYAAAQQELAERTRAEEEQARLLAREQEHAVRLRRLADAALAINASGSVEEALQLIIDQARGLIGAHQAVVSLRTDHPANASLTALSLSGKYAAWNTYATPPVGSGIYRLVEERNAPLRMTQVELESHPAWRGFSAEAEKHPPMRGWLAAPLMARDGGNMGLIQLSDKQEGEFSADDEAILVQLAQMASVTIDNARLFQEARVAESDLRRQLDFTSAITSHLGEGVLVLDREGWITLANPAAAQMLGCPAQELLGTSLASLLGAASPAVAPPAAGDDEAGAPASSSSGPLLEALQTAGTARSDDAALTRADQARLPVACSISPIVTSGEVVGSVFAFHEITERKAYMAALEHQARYDALTGLPNRTLLHERLQQALRQAERNGTPLALMIMDLDGFKDVNDTLGHHYGDLLLQQVGPRMQGALRMTDTVARLGGDEFAILLPGAEDEAALVTAKKLLRALEHRIQIDDLSLHIGASIGIAVFPEHGIDADTLLRRADVAMYVAKRSHSIFSVYSPEQDQYSPARLALLGDLRQALRQESLLLHYQPQRQLLGDATTTVEALVRWQHPQYGLLPPDQFIPLAEQAGLITPLTHWVIDTALQQCAAWRKQGLDLIVAVNLSGRSLHDPQLPGAVAEILARTGMPASSLVLELSESSIMAEPQLALDVLTRLHETGVWLSIDHFGTRYSSLAYLKKLPVDELKIDRSFVRLMSTDENDAVVVRSTVELAHDLGLRVVAEGIEDQTTLDQLSALGCDTGQGYYLARPMPPEAITELLLRRDAE